jgi:drug/metabolite transporter (DMT)-like permease
MIVLGFAPVALVLRYYDTLPNRTVIRWDMFGNTTVIGTRPSTILMVAVTGASIAVLSIALAMLLRKPLAELGLRRAYLALNFAQIVVIALTCGMIVSEALGFQLAIKPMIPPAMAVLLAAAAVLCWRLGGPRPSVIRLVAVLLGLSGIVLLAFSAIAMNAVVGYYASLLALLVMAALVLPERTG